MRFAIVLAALLPGWPAAAPAAQAPQKRPNVIIFIADDWSWPHAGAYGDGVVRTPNFDKVARQGVLFHRAYCAAPSCTPSRAALLTGQWPHRLREGGNLWGTLPQEFVTFPDLLERSGYFVGHTRKGWGPGNFQEAGRTRNPAGPTFKDFRQFLKARPEGRPFCFWFGSTDPHRAYTPGSGAESGMKPGDVKVPPFFPDNKTVRSDILDYYWEVQRFDREVGETLQLLDEAGLTEDTIVIVISDNGMPFPRCKANLYDYGTHMPMAVRWPARVRGGQETAAFVSFQDIAPTLLEAAGVETPKGMTGRSFLDILEGKQAQGRDHVFVERERHANVRKGDLSYPSRAIRTGRYLYIRNFRPDRWPAGDPMTYFAVGPYGDIDGGPTKDEVLKLGPDSKLFRLSCGKRPAEELYDCLADPYELKNVAADPAYKEVKASLAERLQAWMEETDDPRAAAGGGDDRWDRYGYFGSGVGPAKNKGKNKKGGE